MLLGIRKVVEILPSIQTSFFGMFRNETVVLVTAEWCQKWRWSNNARKWRDGLTWLRYRDSLNKSNHLCLSVLGSYLKQPKPWNSDMFQRPPTWSLSVPFETVVIEGIHALLGRLLASRITPRQRQAAMSCDEWTPRPCQWNWQRHIQRWPWSLYPTECTGSWIYLSNSICAQTQLACDWVCWNVPRETCTE